MAEIHAAPGFAEKENTEWLRQALKEADECTEPDLTEEEMDVFFDNLQAKYQKLVAAKATQADGA